MQAPLDWADDNVGNREDDLASIRATIHFEVQSVCGLVIPQRPAEAAVFKVLAG